MKKQVIIVAGGSGLRMGNVITKQFIEIAGKQILLRTLENFYSFDVEMDIVLVLPKHEIETWNLICKTFDCKIKHRVVEGGATRFDSVKNGLNLAMDNAVIAIHDGVRPFVSHKTINNCFEMAIQCGTAVPFVDIVDSIRIKTNNGNVAFDRSQIKAVQTPQVFQSEVLLKAYSQSYQNTFTDDASVVERLFPISLVEGNKENIKITTPFDLQVAELILKNYENR